MYITKISYDRKEKVYIINTDEDTYFQLIQDTFVKFNLYKGKEINKTDIIEMLETNEQYFAINLALKYIRNRKTEKEVFNYLKSKEIKENIINYSINYLKSFNLIDDVQYASDFCNDKIKINKYGQEKIKNLLLLKGIDLEIIEDCLCEISDNIIYDNLIKACQKKMDSLGNDEKSYEKLVRHLISKGYNYDQIKKAIKECTVN
ncbi:RecX family transcriptional regulator [Anaerosphaera multitolerans]|uniref:Regulatory protein RecX n=1 Tax=Anaerosphaera multitolerans TaxID=2487351 RepID=A0A437S7F8_9FIRM|nr:RecX family transcriptional regulator [Anaerosphaera multitolerans]RVU54932.1 hypothetical protein EF514_04930 [Anaerosphaera multitolerans]